MNRFRVNIEGDAGGLGRDDAEGITATIRGKSELGVVVRGYINSNGEEEFMITRRGDTPAGISSRDIAVVNAGGIVALSKR